MSGIYGFSYLNFEVPEALLDDTIGALQYWNRIYGREAHGQMLFGTSGIGCHLEHFSEEFFGEFFCRKCALSDIGIICIFKLFDNISVRADDNSVVFIPYCSQLAKRLDLEKKTAKRELISVKGVYTLCSSAVENVRCGQLDVCRKCAVFLGREGRMVF